MPLPLNLPRADVPIDPYTLGAWLGDGSSTHATMHGDGDADQKWIRHRIDQAYVTTDRPRDQTTFGVLGLRRPLRLSGLLGNKHIPPPYLRASIDQRRELLQGLMDTDGHVAPDGQCEYTTILPQLAFDVQELVRSLGVKAKIITGRATLYGRDCGPKYRVMFYMAGAASIPRKADRCRNAIPPRARRYLTFTETAPVETRCIEVDSPSHLFLAGWSMTPTRNTELCSRWTPAWFTAKYRQPVGLASYEADFAATHGRRVREIIKEVGPRFGLEIDETSRAANRWEVVGGGGMWTAGAGGPITGKGFKLGVVDDPIKNGEEANSPVMREHLWEWWLSTWITRREPGGKMLLIMSRWHIDDLTGRLKKLMASLGMRIKVVRLPAIAEEDDELGRRPGEALCPERYDEEALAGIRKDVGPGPWMSLYQQRPVAVGGGMLKPEWLRKWSSETMNGETYYNLDGQYVLDDELWRFSTMDTAYTRNRTSDYTVIATWGVAPTDPHSLVLLNMQRRRVTHNDHAPMALEEWNTMKPAWIGVEKQMATLSLFDEIARRGVVVRWLTPDRNKVARAETAAALMESGRVWVPEDAPWMADFIDELATFPLGKHDDCVDCLTYAANELSKRTVTPRKVKREPTDASEVMWEKLKKRNKARHSKHHPVLGSGW
jgi:predicted phage terminase large subunit-like protein